MREGLHENFSSTEKGSKSTINVVNGAANGHKSSSNLQLLQWIMCALILTDVVTRTFSLLVHSCVPISLKSQRKSFACLWKTTRTDFWSPMRDSRQMRRPTERSRCAIRARTFESTIDNVVVSLSHIIQRWFDTTFHSNLLRVSFKWPHYLLL